MNRFLQSVIFCALACFLAAAPLQAATLNYVYGGVDTWFNTPGNWGGAAPTTADSAHVDVIANSPVIDATHSADVNELYIGNETAPGKVTMNGGTETITTTFRVGAVVGDSYFEMTGGTLNKTAGGNSVRFGHDGPAGTVGHLDMSGASVLNIPSNNFIFGYGAGNTGYFSMKDTATATVGGVDTSIGFGGIGHWTMTDNSVFNQTAGYVAVGYSGGTGDFDMSGNAALTVSNNWLYVGLNSSATGPSTMTQRGASTILANSTTNMWVMSVGQDGGTGTLNIQDTAKQQSGFLLVGQNGGTGIMNITGGQVTTGSPTWDYFAWGWEGGLQIGRWGGTGTVDMSGGTLDVYGRSAIGNDSAGAGGAIAHGTLILTGTAQLITHAGSTTNGLGWGWTDGGDLWVGTSNYEKGYNGTDWNGVPQTLAAGVGTVVMGTYGGSDSPTMTTSGALFVGAFGGTGTFTLNTGTLTVNGGEETGAQGGGGTGVFIQNGGTHADPAWVSIGQGGANNSATNGTMTINGGVFDHTNGGGGSTGPLWIGRLGGQGTFSQNGGLTEDDWGTLMGDATHSGITSY